jgi:hypothetical protein
MIQSPNHTLQRTRRERRGCNRTFAWAGSLTYIGSLVGGTRTYIHTYMRYP